MTSKMNARIAILLSGIAVAVLCATIVFRLLPA